MIENLTDRTFPDQADRERRTKRRFHIDQEVRYKMLYGQRIAETGTGRTMNISSGGVWFSTESMLTSGMPVELSMNWRPAQRLLPDEAHDLWVRRTEQQERRGSGHRTLRVPHPGFAHLPAIIESPRRTPLQLAAEPAPLDTIDWTSKC